jgi:uncharacterized protein (DUF1501 family)
LPAGWWKTASVSSPCPAAWLRGLDEAFSALLDDLKDRGLLETTIVLVTGEFGRTPEINAIHGRDHWPNVFSLVIAGGGITVLGCWASPTRTECM